MKAIFSTRFMAAVVALLAIVVVAAGCGSDDGGDSGSSSNGDPQAEIRALIEESFAFEDPKAICEENLTEAALEEGYEGKDREARVKACSEDEPVIPDRVEISKVEVKGDTAIASAEAFQPNGRSSKFTIELLNEDGWKINGNE